MEYSIEVSLLSTSMVSMFERQLSPGWIYPCTVEDIRRGLEQLPEEDLEGLWAVGLVCSTRKYHSANARYLVGEKPCIHIYSYPETLAYKLPPYVRHRDIEHGLCVERDFGMRLEPVGSRWWCHWDAEDLRRFIVQHVLPHEVGHHVSHQTRSSGGLERCPGTGACEQFAEAYARRHWRQEKALR